MLKSNYVNSSHLVLVSPWPFVSSMGALGLALGGVYWWHGGGFNFILLGLFLLLMGSFCWWRDVLLESAGGYHSRLVIGGFRFGMVLFILSEVCFFFSFFWSFFHNCLSPSLELGYSWPPSGFEEVVIDPFSIPLLNTVVLLSSGATVTWAHHRIVSSSYFGSFLGLFLTFFLGVYFLFLQGREYACSWVSLNRCIYGSIFFLLTGFHGMHVSVGRVYLLVCLVRSFFSGYRAKSHYSFEMCAWYWHFVDVVWLFLFFFVYWYGYLL